MAPPFRLDFYRPDALKRRNKRMVYPKNEYQPFVRVTNWQNKFFDFPKARENLGPLRCDSTLKADVKETPKECVCDNYRTETQTMLDQRYTEQDKYVIPKTAGREMYNYYCIKDVVSLKECMDSRYNVKERLFTKDKFCAPDYLTTMQNSYRPPVPYIMERLKAPETPFMKYRKMKGPSHMENMGKFLDDGVVDSIKQLQCYKMAHTGISYNFITGYNNNGTIPKLSK